MYLLRFLFYVLSYILISIGDGVIFLLKTSKEKLGFKNSSKKKKKIKIKPVKRLIKNKRKTFLLFVYFKKLQSFKYKAIKISKIIYSELAVFLAALFTFPITISAWALFLLKVSVLKILGREVGLEKIAEKKRHERALRERNVRPSLLYKLKYVTIGIVFSFLTLFLPLLFIIFLSELPNPSQLTLNSIPKTTKIYDRNGELLYEIFANQNRTIAKLSDIPVLLRQATIAIEDKDFYSHPGFDVRGITRALLSNLKNDGGIQGGSTITQQLVKSAFFSSEPSIVRKIKEVVLAFWSERIYTKDEILELYFNYVPYGGTAWGVESASEIYFGKKVSELNLSESAFLAGLPRAPSTYSPFVTNGNLWKKRQKEVLDAMVRQKYITSSKASEAYSQEMSFKSPNVPIKAPHFVMYVRDLLVKKYGLSEVERGGLQVRTSLDLRVQDMAQETVSLEVDNNQYLNIHNGAAVVVSPKNGDILAMIGSKNYFDKDFSGNVNLVTSLRQPGSTIKLVTYALALSSGYTEASILDDTPLVISNKWETYAPVNYDGIFHGKVPLRTAFANSFNIPAVRLAQKLGVDGIVSFGKEMGISSWGNASQYGLSITLGGGEITMLDLATIYATVANNGERVRIDPILEVKDSYGKLIYKKNPISTKVLDKEVAFIISDILADNRARSIEFGLTSPLQIDNKKVSVKTGTTDNKRDNWTVGFTQDLLVATWVGNNDNSPMSQALASGITGAAPMWNKIMTTLLSGVSQQNSPVPSGIVRKFCLGQERYFIKGTENSVSCVVSATPAQTSVTPQP